MWRLAFALLLATAVLQRRATAVLAEEDEAESSNTRERPVYTDGCYLAFLEEGMSKEETDRFYQNVEQEANRGLNVTKMAELREATSGFVFMGDNTSAEEVSSTYHNHAHVRLCTHSRTRTLVLVWVSSISVSCY